MSENEKSVQDMAKEYLELESQYHDSLDLEEEIEKKLREIDQKIEF